MVRRRCLPHAGPVRWCATCPGTTREAGAEPANFSCSTRGCASITCEWMRHRPTRLGVRSGGNGSVRARSSRRGEGRLEGSRGRVKGQAADEGQGFGDADQAVRTGVFPSTEMGPSWPMVLSMRKQLSHGTSPGPMETKSQPHRGSAQKRCEPKPPCGRYWSAAWHPCSRRGEGLPIINTSLRSCCELADQDEGSGREGGEGRGGVVVGAMVIPWPAEAVRRSLNIPLVTQFRHPRCRAAQGSPFPRSTAVHEHRECQRTAAAAMEGPAAPFRLTPSQTVRTCGSVRYQQHDLCGCHPLWRAQEWISSPRGVTSGRVRSILDCYPRTPRRAPQND
jgi:hypothetical protein